MTDEKKQQLIDCLTEAGFWSAEDKGDPSTEEEAVGLVLDRMYKRVGPSVGFIYVPSTTEQEQHEVQVSWEGGLQTLATSTSLNYVICSAAQALPEFLKQHPELVA